MWLNPTITETDKTNYWLLLYEANENVGLFVLCNTWGLDLFLLFWIVLFFITNPANPDFMWYWLQQSNLVSHVAQILLDGIQTHKKEREAKPMRTLKHSKHAAAVKAHRCQHWCVHVISFTWPAMLLACDSSQGFWQHEAKLPFKISTCSCNWLCCRYMLL